MTAIEIISAIRGLRREELPGLLIAIAAVMAEQKAPDADDDLMDVDAAAAMLGVSPSYLYHAKRLNYAVRVGKRRLYSRSRIQKFIAQNAGKV